nr:hypothetical protein [uncultured Prevotella sp.]
MPYLPGLLYGAHYQYYKGWKIWLRRDYLPAYLPTETGYLPA